ncbi:hypothetical protein T484DRAFT_1767191 [Baffinella frigidus]|nr:hypothetical protein T484DRAFT_1767191 [Cryptophyta sp. CCMP2293]
MRRRYLTGVVGGRVITLLSDYVLCQRVKPPAGPAKEAQYGALLVVVHSAMRQAVLCKQSADPDNAEKLHTLLSDVWTKYDEYVNH